MTYSAFFQIIKRKLLYIIVVCLVLSEAFFFVSAFALEAKYEVSSVFCIRNRESEEIGISNTDIAASDALVDAGIVLMQGMHDGIGELTAEKLGAGVFRITLTGSDEAMLKSSLASLTEKAGTEIPQLLGCHSLAALTPITVLETPKHTVAFAFLGAAVGLAVSVTAAVLLENRKSKNGNTTDKEDI